MHINNRIISIFWIVFSIFAFCNNQASAQVSPPRVANLKYYGHYFVEDDGKNIRFVDEVSSFTNIINLRYDSGPNNTLGADNANRVLASGVKVMLQVPFNESQFTDPSVRDAYLQSIKTHLDSLNFMSAVAYFAISEEWYVLISQGFFDNWVIFQNRTRQEQYLIAKVYLEQIIDDVHRIFPGIPTVIVENILPYPAPPSNVDVLGIDGYYIPDNSSCDSTQKAKFNREVIPYYEATRRYGKPLMMVAPSFEATTSVWKMLSRCQMEWYYELAKDTSYQIEAFLWFFYPDLLVDDSGFPATWYGVRSYPDQLAYQTQIGEEILTGIIPSCRGNCAQFISQSGPTSMIAGQTYPISVTMRNIGTTVWTVANEYRLGSQNPQDNFTWGVARLDLPVSVVSSGQDVTFNFNVTAPINSGTYYFQWRMLREFVEWFGDYTPNVTVNVANSCQGNCAQFIFHITPVSMITGQVYPVSIRMKNTGTTTWIPSDAYRLGSQNPENNFIWKVARVELPMPSVSPNQEVTFNFNVTAPPQFGNYNFQWRMLREFVEWFGDYTPNVIVNVVRSSGYSVSGYVYRDLNTTSCCSGIKDPGEAGMANRVVVLTMPNGSTISATTNSNGFYRFSNLSAGNYRITHQVPSGYVRTTDDSTPFSMNSNFVYNFGLHAN